MSTPLHEQIAADSYWEGELAPSARFSFTAAVMNNLIGESYMGTIDRVYQRACVAGSTEVTTVVPGEPLELSIPGSVIKIIEDMRIIPRRPNRFRKYDSVEEFEQLAAGMESTVWYRGPQTGLHLELPNGTFDVARRVSYLVNSQFGSGLAGKDSALLGRGGSHVSLLEIPSYPVGQVSAYKTRRDDVLRRIVSAQILTPAPPARRRARRAETVRTAPRLALGSLGIATA